VFVENATEDWQTQKPSEGVLSALEREVEAVAGRTPNDEPEADEAASDGDEAGECGLEECDGLLIDVFDVGQYLDHNDPPPDVRCRMVAARDWRLGRIEPPPGMKRPQTEKQAREAFEEVL
jgi:hypothetical protein